MSNTSTKKKRQRSIPTHQSFKLSKKRFKHPNPLPSAWKLIKSSFLLVRKNPGVFLGLVAVQSLMTLIFIQGLSVSSELSDAKKNIQESLGGQSGVGENIGTGLALFSYLASTNGSTSGDVSGSYQLFLGIVISLAVIWGTRQILAGEKVSVRDTLYKGMYPLIPFLLVLIVIGIQLLPALIGNLVYSTVLNNGLAVSAIEKILWLVIFLLLIVLSLYMLASSLFGLYIVTLPDMTPIKALRSARKLVLHRRVSVMLRVLVIPVFMLSIALALFVPMVLILPGIAQPLFLIFSSFALVITHIYMYQLYRSLL